MLFVITALLVTEFKRVAALPGLCATVHVMLGRVGSLAVDHASSGLSRALCTIL